MANIPKPSASQDTSVEAELLPPHDTRKSDERALTPRPLAVGTDLIDASYVPDIHSLPAQAEDVVGLALMRIAKKKKEDEQKKKSAEDDRKRWEEEEAARFEKASEEYEAEYKRISAEKERIEKEHKTEKDRIMAEYNAKPEVQAKKAEIEKAKTNPEELREWFIKYFLEIIDGNIVAEGNPDSLERIVSRLSTNMVFDCSSDAGKAKLKTFCSKYFSELLLDIQKNLAPPILRYLQGHWQLDNFVNQFTGTVSLGNVVQQLYSSIITVVSHEVDSWSGYDKSMIQTTKNHFHSSNIGAKLFDALTHLIPNKESNLVAQAKSNLNSLFVDCPNEPKFDWKLPELPKKPKKAEYPEPKQPEPKKPFEERFPETFKQLTVFLQKMAVIKKRGQISQVLQKHLYKDESPVAAFATQYEQGARFWGNTRRKMRKNLDKSLSRGIEDDMATLYQLLSFASGLRARTQVLERAEANKSRGAELLLIKEVAEMYEEMIDNIATELELKLSGLEITLPDLSQFIGTMSELGQTGENIMEILATAIREGRIAREMKEEGSV